jgi:hypothetical protein
VLGYCILSWLHRTYNIVAQDITKSPARFSEHDWLQRMDDKWGSSKTQLPRGGGNFIRLAASSSNMITVVPP